MSNYGDYMKRMAERDKDFFFGEGNKVKRSNKYYEFKHYLNQDEIILNTEQIKIIKGFFVLIVGSNKAVYLKDWQVKEVHNYYDICTDLWLVKLNRKYFKVYTFKNDFAGYEGTKDYSFDDLIEVAKDQDKENMTVANGWMNLGA